MPAPEAMRRDATTIDIQWWHATAEVEGYWLEFATPGADFVKLGVFWPDTTNFSHQQLAADTTYLYRLRPFLGKASEVVELSTPTAPRKQEREREGQFDSTHAAAGATPKYALRERSTRADAAPTGLSAILAAATTAELRWTDRASDEDGYLVEVATNGDDFAVCALLPPDVSSFRKTALPEGAMIRFRVRAFLYGAASEQASASTPREF